MLLTFSIDEGLYQVSLDILIQSRLASFGIFNTKNDHL